MYYHVFLYISCYIAEIWITFLTVHGIGGGYNVGCWRVQQVHESLMINFANGIDIFSLLNSEIHFWKQINTLRLIQSQEVGEDTNTLIVE